MKHHPGRGGFALQDHLAEALGLSLLCKRRSLDRAAVNDRHRQLENLPAMDVSRKYTVEPGWQLAAGNDIGAAAKGEIGGADHGAIHCVMQAQQRKVCGVTLGRTLLHRRCKAAAHIPDIWESAERQSFVTKVETIRARPVEQVDVRMIQEQRGWQHGPLVVAGDDGDGDAATDKIEQRLVCLVDDAAMNLAAEEEIAAVDHQIRCAVPGIVEYTLKIGKKVAAAARAFRAGTDRLVEAEVAVGKKDETNAHLSMILYIYTVIIFVSI